MVRRKVQNTKKLREERLLEENFGIIERDPKNKQYFICRLCEKEGNLFYAGLWNNCESHLESKGHKSALLVHEDQIEGSISSNSSVKSQDSLKFDNTLTDMIEGELDIMYTQFILQYRLPFSIAKPLHALITETSATYNNNLLEQYQISGKIISKAANSFSSTIKNELLEEIRKSPFSLSLDASSDLHGNTYLAVCVRYLEQENEQAPACKLFTILPLTTSSTGETIYKMIKEELLNEEAVQLNFMGIVSDEGSNFAGKHIGVGRRLKDDFEHIVNVNDLSHLFNNIFKKALQAFPKTILDIVTDITSHFHQSSQRTAVLREIQQEMKKKSLEILRIPPTRWLAYRDALDRILEIWPCLQTYFHKYGTEKEKDYFSVDNEVSLRILSLLTNAINKYNELFQKENLYYNYIIEQIQEGFVIFTKAIIQKTNSNTDFNEAIKIPFETKTDIEIMEGKYPSEVKSLLYSEEGFETNFLRKYDSIKDLLPLMDPEKKSIIITTTIKFIYICLRNMKKKLPYFHEIINLSQVIYFEQDFQAEKWLKLKELFPNILRNTKIRDEYVRETEKLEINYKKLKAKYFNPTNDISYIAVWNHLKATYPTIYELARGLLVLPYSSVSVERIFSSLKDIKAPKRSRLTTQNLEACLLGYQYFGTESLQISEKMIEDYQEKKHKKPKVSHAQLTNQDPVIVEEGKEEEKPSTQLTELRDEMKENPLQGERCSSQDKFIENQEPEADDDIYGSMTVRYVKRLDSLKRVSNTNLKPQQTKDLKRNNSESKGSKQ